jgi:hypothetical protein
MRHAGDGTDDLRQPLLAAELAPSEPTPPSPPAGAGVGISTPGPFAPLAAAAALHMSQATEMADTSGEDDRSLDPEITYEQLRSTIIRESNRSADRTGASHAPPPIRSTEALF